MSDTFGPFTLSDVVNYGMVTETAQHCSKVARAMSNGDVLYGIARNVCADESGAYLAPGQDIRTGMLHVTSQGGFEFFWPLSELAAEITRGEFGPYDWK